MQCIVRNSSRGTVLAEHVDVANTLVGRLRGLLGTDTLPPQHGLLIEPCRQVHTYFMRYALDLVFLDGNRRVLRTVADVLPGRVSPHVRGADAVLELPAGTLASTPAGQGDQLVIEPRTPH
jgi:uncharacterized protein